MLNALTVQYVKQLHGTNILVNAACPGYTATDLNRFRGVRNPEQGAAIAIRLATLPDNGPTGGFGTFLALSGASRPSVVLLRRSGRRVHERAETVLLVLDLVADQLATGALVTVDNERVRIRPLPVAR